MPRQIPPKALAGTFAGQRYSIVFDPNAPPHEAWVWRVTYTRAYPRFGAAPTSSYAALHARRFIRKMNAWTVAEEEAE